jgi:hypothetical protein
MSKSSGRIASGRARFEMSSCIFGQTVVTL